MARRYHKLREFRPRERTEEGYAAELTVERLADDGRGVARHRGKVVFVENALPGKRVRGEIFRRSRRFDEAVSTEVIAPSAERQTPPCEYYGRCGGCQLQHLDYSAQVTDKQARLTALLQRLGSDIDPDPPLCGPEWVYRHRARLAFRRNKAASTVGFRQRRSRALVDIDHCPLLEEPLNRALPAVKEALAPLLQRVLSGEIRLTADAAGRIAVALDVENGLSAAQCRSAAERLPPAILTRVVSDGRCIW